MQGGTTHELDVVVALTDDPAGGLADHRKGLDEQVVDLLAPLEPALELAGLGLEALVAEGLHLGLEGVDVRDQGGDGPQLLAFTGAEETIESTHG